MHRWNLTVGLMMAAGAAVLAAPRLVGVVVDALPDRAPGVSSTPPTPPVFPEAIAPSAPWPDASVMLQDPFERTPPVIPEAMAPSAPWTDASLTPELQDPFEKAPPVMAPSAPWTDASLIPELQDPFERTPIAADPVEYPPVQELDPFWDGCPACGMG